MAIIEKGLDQRSLEVLEMAIKQEEVATAEKKFWGLYEKVVETYGHSDLLGDLEIAVCEMSDNTGHAAYRIGVTDGMQLQQEINKLGGR